MQDGSGAMHAHGCRRGDEHDRRVLITAV